MVEPAMSKVSQPWIAAEDAVVPSSPTPPVLYREVSAMTVFPTTL
jgi:hypothetical protein